MKNKGRTHILRDRLETCKDFTFNLLYTIESTFLGNDYIKTPEDIEGHFNWCYSKILKQFYDEELDFFGNDKLYEYYFSYYIKELYKVNEKPLKYYEKHWNVIFNLNNKKTQKKLIELYNVFEKSFIDNCKKINIDEKILEN